MPKHDLREAAAFPPSPKLNSSKVGRPIAAPLAMVHSNLGKCTSVEQNNENFVSI